MKCGSKKFCTFLILGLMLQLSFVVSSPYAFAAGVSAAGTTAVAPPKTAPAEPTDENGDGEISQEERDKWQAQVNQDLTNQISALQNQLREAQLKQGGGGGGGGHEGGGQPPMMMPPPPPPPPPPPNNPPPPPPQPPPPPLPPPAALGPATNDNSKTEALEKQIQEQKELLAQMNSEKKSSSSETSDTDLEIARIQENARLQQEKLVNDTIARIQAGQNANQVAQSQIDAKQVAADQKVVAANKGTIADRMRSGSPVAIDLAGSVPGQPGRAFTGSYSSGGGTPNLPQQANIRGVAAPPPPPPFPGRGVRIDNKGAPTGSGGEREPSSDSSSIFNLFASASAEPSESAHFTGPMIIPRDLKVVLEANRAMVGGSTPKQRNILPGSLK